MQDGLSVRTSNSIILQLIDEDVRNPNISRGYGNFFDSIKVLWIPHQELIFPWLKYSGVQKEPNRM